MKLTFVSPRYGTEVVGGSEQALRAYAEQIVARSDVTVQVLTTTALDADRWAPGYAAGRAEVNGVVVERFALDHGRSDDFGALCDRLLPRAASTTPAEQEAWLHAQGPVSSALSAAVARCEADVVALGPYLFHPTVDGVRRLGARTVLHPAAHDEAPLGLPMYRDLMLQAGALAFWSEAECRLVNRRFPVAARRQATLGIGVEAGAGTEAAARAAVGLGPDEPFLLCLGRVDDGKGTRLLAELFRAYRNRRSDAPRLVFAGPVVHPLPSDPGLLVAGAVDDAVKWGLLRGASALVSPSAQESFGIVLLEAWAVGTPVLVNTRCEVTSEHTRDAGGGLGFGSYAEFEAVADLLLAEPGAGRAMGGAGRSYVERQFSWDRLVQRYLALCASVARHARHARHARPARSA